MTESARRTYMFNKLDDVMGVARTPRLDLLRKLHDFLPDDPEAFDVNSWQGTLVSGTSFTREELHKCGNTACIAGYASLMPEWAQNGGYIDDITSSPALVIDANLTLFGAKAFAAVFQLPLGLAAALTQPSILVNRTPLGRCRINDHTRLMFGNHKGSVADLIDPLATDFSTSLTLFAVLMLVAEGGWEKVGDPLPRAIRSISQVSTFAEDVYDINFNSLFDLWGKWTPDHARRALHWITNKLEAAQGADHG